MNGHKGFTLFELLITMAVLLSLLTLAVPSYQWFRAKTHAQLINRQLSQAIQLARTEAMSRGFVMTLCGSRDQKTCDSSWSKGFLVRDSERLYFAYRNTDTHDKLHWRSFPQSRNVLQFTPSGITRIENGTFWYCNQSPKPFWAMVINQSGRVRWVFPDKNGDIDVGGEMLVCDDMDESHK